MAAFSTTGTGNGDSNGKFKPKNGVSCGCGAPNEEVPEIKRKKSCYVTLTQKSCYSKYVYGSRSSYKTC